MNVQESDFGGGPALKSDEIHLLTDTEKWLHYTEVSTDDRGKTSKASWSGPQDGSMRPVAGMPGAKAGYKTEDDSSRFIMADGTEFDTVMTMSDDKKKVTEKVTVKDKAGHEFHQTLVYDRTK